MSDVIPHYGCRCRTWDFRCGPMTYAELPDDVDPERDELPPVNYEDAACDHWFWKIH